MILRRLAFSLAAVFPPAICLGQWTASLIETQTSGYFEIKGGDSASQVGNLHGASTHAALWHGEASSLTDLNPFEDVQSRGMGASGNAQVGYVYPTSNDWGHAALWQGTAASFVDLNPTNFYYTVAMATHAGVQGGFGYRDSNSPAEALLWRGSAESVVNLNPSGWTSQVNGVWGDYQIGIGGEGFADSAILWHGTAESAISLTPPGYSWSRGMGINGGHQVGYAQGFAGSHHATLWSGSAESAIDLNPAGSRRSAAYAVAGDWQAGYVTPGYVHAAIWNGSAESCIDLQSFLPANLITSEARVVSEDGSTVYGVAYTSASGSGAVAVKWSRPVPEPCSALVLALGLASTRLGRRRVKR